MSTQCRGFIVPLIAIAVGGVASNAAGQWTAIRLQQPGDRDSAAFAASGQQIGGYRIFAGSVVPGLWDGPSGAWTPLITTPGLGGFVNAMSPDTQVGGFGPSHACLWRGTPESHVDLHFAGRASEALAVSGDSQGGLYHDPVTDLPRAVLWHGSAASAIPLHPAGAYQSQVRAIEGDLQGGFVQFDVNLGEHAVLWQGSAGAWTDLNPAGRVESNINAMAAGVQAGWARSGNAHAALWMGTAQSFIDLHPFPGFGSSAILGTTGTVHVGYSNVPGGGFPHAGVWFGTSNALLDLHELLPPGYSASEGTAVSQVGNTVYVAGRALGPSGFYEAFLWTGPVPAPGAAATLLLSAGVLARRRRR